MNTTLRFAIYALTILGALSLSACKTTEDSAEPPAAKSADASMSNQPMSETPAEQPKTDTPATEPTGTP
jgi:hypothetical protein